MASRSIDDLTPEAQAKYWEWAGAMRAANLPYMVTCTYRTQQEQEEQVWAQGRIKPGPIITWTKNSMHTKRIAWDIAILIGVNKPTWNLKVDVDKDQEPDYIEAAEVGRKCGLTVGADFPHPDYPHFQLRIE